MSRKCFEILNNSDLLSQLDNKLNKNIPIEIAEQEVITDYYIELNNDLNKLKIKLGIKVDNIILDKINEFNINKQNIIDKYDKLIVDLQNKNQNDETKEINETKEIKVEEQIDTDLNDDENEDLDPINAMLLNRGKSSMPIDKINIDNVKNNAEKYAHCF